MKSIAIDGPAGAGKSTIAKLVAKEMGYVYVDTGAMYRAMGIYYVDNNIDKNDEKAISDAVDNIDIVITYEDGAQQVILNGENVTGRLRTEAAGNMASAVAVYGAVRSKLVSLQQKLATTTNVIMDGRDIGTVVLPNATLKIYLTASVEARAKRRYDELVEKGQNPSYEQIVKDIETRDYNDMNRAISPLKKADDAIFLDSSNMTIDEVKDAIIKLFNER